MRELKKYRTVGIISCGGCPARLKNGGTIGVDALKNQLKNKVDVKWNIVCPNVCDARFFTIHLDELGNNLHNVDAVLLMACEAGKLALKNIVGFPIISVFETSFLGYITADGDLHKVANIEKK